MFDPVRFCWLCYFELQWCKSKIFPKFHLDRVIAGIQQLQCYHKWLETKENSSMNVVNQYGDKRNGFAELAAFFLMICRYFDRFLLQGVDRNQRQACLFYLTRSLICEGYWQVNSWRLIFLIADPNVGSKDRKPTLIWQNTNWGKIYLDGLIPFTEWLLTPTSQW